MLPHSVAVHALTLTDNLQVVILTGSTLMAALCVLALKSLPHVQKPVNSPGAKLKLKVGLPHELAPPAHPQASPAHPLAPPEHPLAPPTP